MKEIEGIHNNKPLSKQIEHVVGEGVNDDELVKDDNRISLKERPMEDMEGDESTSNSSLKQNCVPSQYEGLKEPQKNGQRERPKNNIRNGLVIGGLPPTLLEILGFATVVCN
jgi:hypothetical protein